MKKIFISVLAALATLVSCSEWDPVFTRKYAEPSDASYVTRAQMEAKGTIISISELCAMYKNTPVTIEQDLLVCGQVSSSDKSGNIYKSLYIQDETGGIEVKIGRYSLYDEYKPGQTVYVYLNGLTIGMYGYKSGNYGGNGMVQIGLNDPTGEYETAYLELPQLVNMHVFRGAEISEVTPTEISESDLPGKNATPATCKYLGELVTLKNISYSNEVFVLLYLTYNKSTKDANNRIFLSDSGNWGITTWAMSKLKMSEYLESGIWDTAQVGSGSAKYEYVSEHKDVSGTNGSTYGDIERNAYSVSQYFKMGSTEIQVRTSGYSDFADFEIPSDVLNGSRNINVTGILSLYQGSIQFTLIDENSITYADTGDYLY